MATSKKKRVSPEGYSFKRVNEVPATRQSIRQDLWGQAKDLPDDKSVEIAHPANKEGYIRACLGQLNKEHNVSLSFRRISDTSGLMFHNPNKVARGRKKKK